MNGFRKVLPSALGLAVVSLGASGCASLHHAKWASVTSVQVGGSDATAADGFYADAVAAIEARDYGQALDLLQLARRERRDVRVLNAFGVVYDKLGRFDLSARYYREALMLEPASPLVRANMAYSQQLQDEWRSPRQVAQAASAPPAVAQPATDVAPAAAPAAASNALAAAAQPRLLAAPASAWPLVPPNAPEPPRTAPAPRASASIQPVAALHPEAAAFFIRTGGIAVPQASDPASPTPVPVSDAPALAPIAPGVTLITAAGDGAVAERLRRYLSGLKWSAGPVINRVGHTPTRTVVRYPEGRGRLARALARSLPGPVALSACETRCGSLKILLGSDVRLWRTSAAAYVPHPRRG